MQRIIPSSHDHLKAHQFKFERDELGECKMFYKEWSTDDYWLPQSGLSLLPAGSVMYESALYFIISILLCISFMFNRKPHPY